MGYQVTPGMPANALIFLLAAVLTGYGAARYRQERHRRELLAFASLMGALASWELLLVVVNLGGTRRLWTWGTYLADAVVVPLFLYSFVWFALTYADFEEWADRRLAGLALAHVLLVSLGFVLDPEFMHGYGEVVTRGPVTVLSVTFEEWTVLELTSRAPFLLFQLYASGVVLGCGALLGRHMYRNRAEVSAGHATALAVGVGAPLLANLLVFAGVVPLARNFIDISVGVSALALAVTVFRYRILRVAPVGRKQLVETMGDPVVLLDEGDRVVDSNRAARTLVDAGADWRGLSVERFFDPFPEQAEQFRDATARETEIRVETGGRTRYFDLRVSPIRPEAGQPRGRIVVLREVTPLKEREQELDLLRQIQSRVLRHNIRNDLQAIQLYGEQLADTAEDDAAAMAAEILGVTDDLLSTSEKTRVAERLLETDQTPVRIDLAATLDDIVADARAAHPAVSFSLHGPDHCVVETVPAMEFAFRNLVENAAEHNAGERRTVDLSVTADDEGAVVTVADDGPGIPAHELRVLAAGEETQLEHGSGVGLWAVQWAVDATDATVDYETGSGGTTVRIRFPAGSTVTE